jgi:hypothetical protein
MDRSRPALTNVDDLSPEGRIAAWTIAGLLAVTGIATIVAAWDEVWQICGDELRGECVSRSSAAILASGAATAVIVVAVVIGVRTRRRATDPEGSSRWTWVLGGMTVVGAVVISGRIPAFTCVRGRFDELLGLCLHPPSTSEPSSWMTEKGAIVVAGVVLGLVVAARPSWIRVTAPLAALVWLAGFGWLIADTLVRHG